MTEKETKTMGKKKGKKTKEEEEMVEEKAVVEKEIKETKKKGSKLIPKPKAPEIILDTSSLLSMENKKQDKQEKPEKEILSLPTEPETTLPNVVVRLRCQLADLNRPMTDENQISNPYEYKAWIPSEIKTYNTTDFQTGSLSMEPIHFMGLEALHGKGGCGEESIVPKEIISGEENRENEENYAYLDAKWLHSGLMNKINISDVTPMLKQIRQPSGTEMSSNGIKQEEVGKKRDSEGVVRSGPFTSESSEYSKAPISKDIQTKLYQQKVLLYHGLVQHKKKSACFWCTCEYDTPACAIPYYNVDGSLDGYGSFCRPECAVAYLYSEKLDDSVRADRDHLINFYYGKAYGYEKRIKPAPDPHYLLDKFFGNLTIQEYRKLLKSEHLLATLDKPMTRIFPELHEITDDFLIQIYGGDITLNRGYRVKRASEQVKGPSKMEILRDQFKKPTEKGT
jgi:hypothetical protein